MDFLRTPDEHFENLPGFNFAPHYAHIDDTEGGQLRMHYLDEGPRKADPVLLMHGEPSWSFLYRKMIPTLVEAGHRIIAPDLIGFGRSDKPTRREDYTYQRHVDWCRTLLEQLKLDRITLVCQDWGGLIGLRLVADRPDQFARVVAANTMLPTGEEDPGEAFRVWQQYAQTVEHFHAGGIVKGGTVTKLDQTVVDAYNAPFPDENYKAGAREFPALVPTSADDPGAAENRAAWKVLEQWDKPFMTAFSDRDPITEGGDRIMQKRIPGTQGQAHVTVENAGHFLQEDQGEALATVVARFIADNPR